MAVETVREALARGKPFDAVVLDMQMPVMDGFQAAPRLRAAGHTGRVVALTANAMKGDQERCLAAGCDEYLAKPVDRLRLLYVLAHGGRVHEPAAAEPVAGSLASAAHPGNGGGSYRGRVLVVDDSDDATEMLSILLEAQNIEVTTAKNGAEALARALTAQPHVVVLDLGLPDVDGYAVLEHLKTLESLRATRFIALTGRSGREEQQRMLEAGFHHQLVKPPDFNHLIDLIKLGAT
jgi:two-component system CheB/CheR fusion protein